MLEECFIVHGCSACFGQAEQLNRHQIFKQNLISYSFVRELLRENSTEKIAPSCIQTHDLEIATLDLSLNHI